LGAAGFLLPAAGKGIFLLTVKSQPQDEHCDSSSRTWEPQLGQREIMFAARNAARVFYFFYAP
jgi:hypothetical protein